MKDGDQRINGQIRLPVEEVRSAARDMMATARQEGVDPAGPLGVMIEAIGVSMDRFAGLLGEVQRDAFGAVREARKLGEVELEKLRAANVAAEIVLNQAKAAQTVLEVQREALVGKMVREVAPKMVDAVGEAVVIRERRLNRNIEMARVGAYASVAIVLLLSGYVGRWYQDDMAVNALERCAHTAVVETGTGKQYCALESLLPR